MLCTGLVDLSGYGTGRSVTAPTATEKKKDYRRITGIVPEELRGNGVPGNRAGEDGSR